MKKRKEFVVHACKPDSGQPCDVYGPYDDEEAQNVARELAEIDPDQTVTQQRLKDLGA